MLPAHLHPCLALQKRQILLALNNLSSLEFNDERSDDPPESANQVAYQQLQDLITGTVCRGEGNSCLLIGPRGSGKTSLVSRCVAELAEQPIVLRLSGWVQTTDRLALREIAVQLNEQTGNVYLALTENGQEDEEPNPFLDAPLANVPFGQPSAAHLPTLISLLPTLPRPTIVILDAFDLFSLHPRQSLLYCLLDTVQSCGAGPKNKGVAVIGVTTRMDSINLLEKRVKSRFSGRMIRTASPAELSDWTRLTRTILCAEPIPPADSGIKHHLPSWRELWHPTVDKFCADEAVLAMLNDTFCITKDVRMLSKVLTHLVVHLSPQVPLLTASQLAAAVAKQRAHPHYPFLQDLPYPCICLLVAAYHWDTAGHPNFTFEMLYESFRHQVRASSSAPVQVNGGSIGMMRCSRMVMLRALENLISAHIFDAIAAPNSSIAKEFVKYRCTLERDDIRKATDKCGQTNVKKWLSKAQ